MVALIDNTTAGTPRHRSHGGVMERRSIRSNSKAGREQLAKRNELLAEVDRLFKLMHRGRGDGVGDVIDVFHELEDAADWMSRSVFKPDLIGRHIERLEKALAAFNRLPLVYREKINAGLRVSSDAMVDTRLQFFETLEGMAAFTVAKASDTKRIDANVTLEIRDGATRDEVLAALELFASFARRLWDKLDVTPAWYHCREDRYPRRSGRKPAPLNFSAGKLFDMLRAAETWVRRHKGEQDETYRSVRGLIDASRNVRQKAKKASGSPVTPKLGSKSDRGAATPVNA